MIRSNVGVGLSAALALLLASILLLVRSGDDTTVGVGGSLPEIRITATSEQLTTENPASTPSGATPQVLARTDSEPTPEPSGGTTSFGRVTAELTDEPSAGGAMTFMSVQVDVERGDVAYVGMVSGDGTTGFGLTKGYYSYTRVHPECTATPAGAHHVSLTLPIAWRTTGEKAVAVDVYRSNGCDSSRPMSFKRVSLTHTVSGKDAEATNGPQLPKVDFYVTRTDKDCAELCVRISASDLDGIISDLVVDWGDGTSDRIYSGEGCASEPAQHWPRNPKPVVVNTSHPVKETRSPTLHFTSAGCDGGSLQSYVQRIANTGTKPSPSPTPTPLPVP